MTRIILVRHAETDWNKIRRIQGSSNPPLNDTGRAQAERTSRYLTQESIATVISSPLQRAVETAEIVARPHALEVTTQPALREINFGEWEGLSIEEVAAKWPKEWAEYLDNPALHRPPNAESTEEYLLYVRAYLDSIRLSAEGDDSTICLVGHSGSVRALLTCALNGNTETWIRINVYNASVSEIKINERGRTEIIRMNDFSFL